jgi:hypothetical protein
LLKIFLTLFTIALSCYAAPGFYQFQDERVTPSMVIIKNADQVIGHGFYIDKDQVLVPREFFESCLDDLSMCRKGIENFNGEEIQILSLGLSINNHGNSINYGQDFSLLNNQILNSQIDVLKSFFITLKVKQESIPIELATAFTEDDINETKLVGILQNSPIRNDQFYDIAKTDSQRKLNELKQSQNNLRLLLEQSEELDPAARQLCLLNQNVSIQMDEQKKDIAKALVCRNYLKLEIQTMQYDIDEYIYALNVLAEVTDNETSPHLEFSQDLGIVYSRGVMTTPRHCRIYKQLPAGDMRQFPTQIAFTTNHDFTENFKGAPLINDNYQVLGVYFKPSLSAFNPTEINQLYGSDAVFLSASLIRSIFLL